jgi:PelA/Pel-15E family pectate lyase
MTHAVEILHDVATGAADYTFVSPALARRAGPAADRGIECLLKLQIVENGVKTAWAQQYDALTLEPTSARNYEMASLTSDESYPVAEFFMQLPNPTPAEVAAVHAAAAWFTKVEIFGYRYGSGNFGGDRNNPDGRKLMAVSGAGPIWSRYYQIGTDKPIFGDRDKSIHDDVNELSRERRNGYSWYNTAGIATLAEYKTWAQTHPK